MPPAPSSRAAPRDRPRERAGSRARVLERHDVRRLARVEVVGQRLRVALPDHASDEVVERDPALFLPLTRAALADRDLPRGSLLVADDEDVVRAAMLRLAHLRAQVTGLRVECDPDPLLAQERRDLVGIPACGFAHRDDRDLLPGEPEREVAGVVLDEPAHEALEAAE